jgi:hypothetical protein
MLGHRVNSEGLRGRANAPRRRRTQEDLYRVRPRFLSTFPSARRRKKAPIFADFCRLPLDVRQSQAALHKTLDYRRIRHLFAGRAVLRPHSSADP